MRIEIGADTVRDKKLVKLAGKTVQVKKCIKSKPKITHFVFEYKDQEFKIPKRFAKVI